MLRSLSDRPLKGAQIILIQELFESQYFCMDQKEELFELSKPFDNHPTIKKFSELAKELKVVLPVSFLKKQIGLIIIQLRL